MAAPIPAPASETMNPKPTLEVRAGLLRHMPSLRAHAQRRTRCAEEAEDVVQEVCVRALTFAWSYQAGTNVRAWLHQVLESVFVTRCRRRGRERRAFDALGRDPCAWIQKDATPHLRCLSPRVSRALENLPASFRDVVRLVDVEELSYRDAAERLAIPLGTVMSRLSRGRRLLAGALADQETEAQTTQRAA
jgi:RNA polymerase sigma-70 factor (ECF subfamily)